MDAADDAYPDLRRVGALDPHKLAMFVVYVLVAIGLVMIFSSSFVATERGTSRDGFYYVRRQLLWTVLALAALGLSVRIPRAFWRRAAPWLLGGTVLLLLLLLVPGMATDGEGKVRRWFRFAGFGFQPSEFAKLALVLGLSHWLTLVPGRALSFLAGFCGSLALIGIVTVPVLLQPDVGTAIFLATVGLALAFLAGVRLRYLVPAGAVALPASFFAAWQLFPHVRERLQTFLQPDADTLGKGHQVKQALIGLGAGGDWGVGLGLSRQKLFYLPERHTDFIFAVLGEELGLAGTLVVLALFVTLVLALRRVAARAPDPFSFLVTSGMMLLIGLQAAMNVAVVTGAIPPKGISLPFVSYGGSGLLAMMVGMGIVYALASGPPSPANAAAPGRKPWVPSEEPA